MMINSQLHKHKPTQTFSIFPKHTLITGPGNNVHFPIRQQNHFHQKQPRGGLRAASRTIKAQVTAAPEVAVTVKAVVTVKLTVGGLLTNAGVSRGLDDIADLVGKTLLLELASTDLDSSKWKA